MIPMIPMIPTILTTPTNLHLINHRTPRTPFHMNSLTPIRKTIIVQIPTSRPTPMVLFSMPFLHHFTYQPRHRIQTLPTALMLSSTCPRKCRVLLIRPMDGPSLLRAPNLTTPRSFSHIDNAPDQTAAVVTRTEEAPANKEPVMGSGEDGTWKHGFHAAGPRAEAGGDADRLIYYPIMWNKEKIPSNQEILGVCRVIE
jgi:hypothetical protein